MALKKTKEQIVDGEQRPQKRKASTHRNEEQPEKKTKRVKHRAEKEPEYDTTDDDTEMELELKEKRKEKSETRTAKGEKISKKREEETEARKTKKTQKMMRQQKCTLVAFWKEMNKFRDEIPLQTWLFLENTVVWPMIKPFFEHMMSEEQIIKKEIDIEMVLKHYEKETREFRFG